MISLFTQRRASLPVLAVAIAGFLLPWQAVWIIRPGILGGVPWPLATIGLYAGDAVLLAVAIIGFLRRRRTHPQRLLFLSAILIVTAFTNALTSADPWLSIVGWVRIVAFLLAIAGLPYEWRTTRVFLLGFLVAMGVQAIIGIAQFLTQTIPASTLLGITAHGAWIHGDAVIEAFGGRWLRAYGGFPHPNIFGLAVLVAMMAASVFYQNTRSSRQRVGFYFVFCIYNFALVLSFSRSALLGLLILLFLLVRKIETRRLAVIGSVALVATVALTWPFWVPRATIASRAEQRSMDERRAAFADARVLSTAHPFLGVGLHAMPQALLNKNPTRNPYSAQPVHNIPLLAFVELGFVAIALLLLAAGLLFRYSTFNPTSPKLRGASIQYSILLVLLPSLIFDHALWSLAIGPVLLFVLLMSMSLDNVSNVE